MPKGFSLLSLGAAALAVLHATAGSSQDFAFDFAEHLYESLEYDEAITEYERFIFFNPSSDSISEAYYKIGMAYRNQMKWTEAQEWLRASALTAPDDSSRDDRVLAIGIVFLAEGDYSAAELQFLKLQCFSRFPDIRRKAAFFRGVTCIYVRKWLEAKTAFQACSTAEWFCISRDQMRLDSLLSDGEYPGYKSPATAELLSTVVPGVGQAYAGSLRDGLSGFLLNAGTAYVVLHDIAAGDYTNAVFDLLFLFKRYYAGNRRSAREIAETHNRFIDEKRRNEVLQILSNVR